MAILARADRPCPKEPTHSALFCSFVVWTIGPVSVPIRSPWKLSRSVHRKSSAVPVSTVVFTQGAIAMAMTGGNASRPIVCRTSIGRPISAHPSAPAAIVALTCAISAEGCSGLPHLPIGIQIAIQLFPRAFPSAALTSRSLPRWRKRLPAISISLLRTIDDPRGQDDEIFWEATQRAGGHLPRDTRGPLFPKAKPPPTPAQIAAYREFSARAAGYQAGSGRPKAKAAPDAAFRAAERDLIALLGGAPLDDPIEEPSPPDMDPIEDFS